MVESSPDITKRLVAARYVIFLITTTIMVLILAFVWYMSPLGIGFIDKPSQAWVRTLAENMYFLSYFIGIPCLLTGQIASVLFYLNKKKLAAYIIPTLTIGIFVVLVASVMALFSIQPA